MITVDELVNITDVQEEQASFKLGTVVELFGTGTAKVQFDGEESPSQKEYTYLASYTPRLNDRVLLASIGGTYIIFDAIYHKQTPNNSLGEISGEVDQINTTLETKIASDMADDVNGSMNIDSIYVEPGSKQLRVLRKNGEWTYYVDKAAVDTALGIKITSNMGDDVGGNMNVDYMYVDPVTKKLHVRRKNGVFTSYNPA